MKTLFSPKEQAKTATQDTVVSMPARKPYDLVDLYDELGRLKWHNPEAGWDRAIQSIREEIRKYIKANQVG